MKAGVWCIETRQDSRWSAHVQLFEDLPDQLLPFTSCWSYRNWSDRARPLWATGSVCPVTGSSLQAGGAALVGQPAWSSASAQKKQDAFVHVQLHIFLLKIKILFK